MTRVPRIDDPEFVRSEYADDTRLSARADFWRACPGPQPQDVACDRIVEMKPRALLEVGCGQGQLAARLTAAGVDVTATDRSAQMVATTAVRGVCARQADVQDLPFEDGAFDVVLAAYMLYHVPDLSRALDEIVRVLSPGGSLVAVVNSVGKLREMWELVGRDPDDGSGETVTTETGTEHLRSHFARIERIDVAQPFHVSRDAVRAYIQATRFAALADNLPQLPDGLRVTAAGGVFIASGPQTARGAGSPTVRDS